MVPYYVSDSTSLSKEGELGTFASKDLPVDYDLGYAIDIPMGTQRPDLEWNRSELCKLTNHSFNPNLRQDSHRYKGGTIVHYFTNRPIKKGEELLVNYKEFDFHTLIDMSFLDPTAGQYLLYFRIKPSMLKFHKNFGICSPKRLSELSGTSSSILDDFFDRDIKHLPNHSFHLNDSSIMFSMFPLTEYHPTYMTKYTPCIEFTIDTLKFQSFLPIIIYRNKVRNRFCNWDIFRTDDVYDDMKKLVNTSMSDQGDPLIVGIKDAFHIDLELCERTYRIYDEQGNFKNVSIR